MQFVPLSRSMTLRVVLEANRNIRRRQQQEVAWSYEEVFTCPLCPGCAGCRAVSTQFRRFRCFGVVDAEECLNNLQRSPYFCWSESWSVTMRVVMTVSFPFEKEPLDWIKLQLGMCLIWQLGFQVPTAKDIKMAVFGMLRRIYWPTFQIWLLPPLSVPDNVMHILYLCFIKGLKRFYCHIRFVTS